MTHSIQCVQNILINIICKYNFISNVIHYNYSSILRNTGYQITNIKYEYAFIPLSSSKRDEDMNSEFDKFESYTTKADSALASHIQIAAEEAMDLIRQRFGPFDPDEINFFKRRLAEDGQVKINSLQKMMVFNLFYKYFQDTQTVNCINLDDYVTLILAARKILEENGMYLLGAIVSSKVVRLATRKSINKKEMTKLESSELHESLKRKYRNDKIVKQILGIIAIILSSDFEFIDYTDPDINGRSINVTSEIASEEVQMYVSMV